MGRLDHVRHVRAIHRAFLRHAVRTPSFAPEAEVAGLTLEGLRVEALRTLQAARAADAHLVGLGDGLRELVHHDPFQLAMLVWLAAGALVSLLLAGLLVWMVLQA